MKSFTPLLRLVLCALVLTTVFAAVQPPSRSAVDPDPDDEAVLHPVAAHAVADGKTVYMSRCMSCHQMNGQGVQGVFPPLDGSEWVTGDKGRLIRIILGGMMGEMEVQGVKYSGAMPPWGPSLTDEDVAALSTYIRSEWSNDASPVTAAEVAAVRAATKDRGMKPWTADELSQEENLGIPGHESASTN